MNILSYFVLSAVLAIAAGAKYSSQDTTAALPDECSEYLELDDSTRNRFAEGDLYCDNIDEGEVTYIDVEMILHINVCP